MLPGATIYLVSWARVIFWKLDLHSFSLTVILLLSNVTTNDKTFSFFTTISVKIITFSLDSKMQMRFSPFIWLYIWFWILILSVMWVKPWKLFVVHWIRRDLTAKKSSKVLLQDFVWHFPSSSFSPKRNTCPIKFSFGRRFHLNVRTFFALWTRSPHNSTLWVSALPLFVITGRLRTPHSYICTCVVLTMFFFCPTCTLFRNPCCAG